MVDKRLWCDQVAMELAGTYERSRGWEAADVSSGFGPRWATQALETRDQRIHLAHLDYISRDVTGEHHRFIEVKSRSTSGPVDINDRQRKAFESLGPEAWLYVIFDCRAAWDARVTDPYLTEIGEPRRLPWQEERGGWRVSSEAVVEAGTRAFSKLPVRLYPPRALTI